MRSSVTNTIHTNCVGMPTPPTLNDTQEGDATNQGIPTSWTETQQTDCWFAEKGRKVNIKMEQNKAKDLTFDYCCSAYLIDCSSRKYTLCRYTE